MNSKVFQVLRTFFMIFDSSENPLFFMNPESLLMQMKFCRSLVVKTNE